MLGLVILGPPYIFLMNASAYLEVLRICNNVLPTRALLLLQMTPKAIYTESNDFPSGLRSFISVYDNLKYFQNSLIIWAPRFKYRTFYVYEKE